MKRLDNFNWYLMVFCTLKLIVFKNINEFINFAVFFVFCLIVFEGYCGMLPYVF